MPHPLLISTYRFGFRALDTLRLDVDNTRLAAAITLGFALGLTPLFTLHELCFALLLMVLRVNPISTLLSAAFFALLAAPCDGLFHQMGLAVLTPPAMHRAWAGFYHWPILPHTRFYNTVVMGRWIVTVLGAGPVFFGSRALLARHRGALESAIRGSAIGRSFATSRLYRLYASYHQK